MSGLLPPEYADLEPFAAKWCLATETERFERRMASSMTEMQAFYDTFFPRLEEAIEYCDKHPLDDLPEDVEHLLQLIYSLIMVSMAVEIFHQPKTVDAADAVLVRTRDPRP
ncbi:MAG TPA: hypothetical protein VLX59_02145 [Acidimicrobiales bacterium]|nr:hypothetical protein [Acidimicrobiales bacterium]